MRILLLAGLPGTGKSSLGRELSRLLRAPILDKDALRETLFGPHWVEYSRTQDDLCVSMLYEAVRHLARAGSAPLALLDGRTYTRPAALDQARQLATEIGARLEIIECVCSERLALERIASDAGRHPAANRDAELYRRLEREAEPIPEPKRVVDTSTEPPRTLAERLADELVAGWG